MFELHINEWRSFASEYHDCSNNIATNQRKKNLHIYTQTNPLSTYIYMFVWTFVSALKRLRCVYMPDCCEVSTRVLYTSASINCFAMLISSQTLNSKTLHRLSIFMWIFFFFILYGCRFCGCCCYWVFALCALCLIFMANIANVFFHFVRLLRKFISILVPQKPWGSCKNTVIDFFVVCVCIANIYILRACFNCCISPSSMFSI